MSRKRQPVAVTLVKHAHNVKLAPLSHLTVSAILDPDVAVDVHALSDGTPVLRLGTLGRPRIDVFAGRDSLTRIRDAIDAYLGNEDPPSSEEPT